MFDIPDLQQGRQTVQEMFTIHLVDGKCSLDVHQKQLFNYFCAQTMFCFVCLFWEEFLTLFVYGSSDKKYELGLQILPLWWSPVRFHCEAVPAPFLHGLLSRPGAAH